MNAENASPRNVPFRYAVLLALALFCGFAGSMTNAMTTAITITDRAALATTGA